MLETENKNKFKQFFREEYGAMRSYIRLRIGDAADRTADDIIQDVALKLFSRNNYSSPINDVAAYVYYAIKNKITDIFRMRKQIKLYESEHGEKFEADVNEFTEVIYGNPDNDYSDEMKAKLLKAIEDLKLDYRNVIIAINFEGWSYKKAADELNVPIGTLLSRHHRAMSALMKQFSNNNNLKF